MGSDAGKYKGIVIEESLTDPSVLEDVTVISSHVDKDQDNPDGLWHIFTVEVTRGEIEKLQNHLKREDGWYMHFWQDRDVIVVFRDKSFQINYDDKRTWKDAVEYGRLMGVPDEQLDFLIE